MSQHLGTTNFLDTPTVNSVDVLLNAGGVPSIASGTALPAAGTAGRWFLLTTTGVLYRDTGAAWVQAIIPDTLQTVVFPITAVTGTGLIPFDNTTPLSTEGILVWSGSFTPVSATSTILITVNSFAGTSSAADVTISGAVFNGTTCIGAQALSWGTNANNPQNFSVVTSQVAGSTAARTYSFRAGGSTSVSVSIGQGTGSENFGSTTNSGRVVITEIAG